jgi:hypothetical protein
LLLGAEGKLLYSKLKAVETMDLFSGMGDAFDLGRAIRDQWSSGGARPRRKILMLAANPLDKPRLRLDEEQREIKNRVRMLHSTKVELEFMLEPAANTGHSHLHSRVGRRSLPFQRPRRDKWPRFRDRQRNAKEGGRISIGRPPKEDQEISEMSRLERLFLRSPSGYPRPTRRGDGRVRRGDR